MMSTPIVCYHHRFCWTDHLNIVLLAYSYTGLFAMNNAIIVVLNVFSVILNEARKSACIKYWRSLLSWRLRYAHISYGEKFTMELHNYKLSMKRNTWCKPKTNLNEGEFREGDSLALGCCLMWRMIFSLPTKCRSFLHCLLFCFQSYDVTYSRSRASLNEFDSLASGPLMTMTSTRLKRSQESFIRP